MTPGLNPDQAKSVFEQNFAQYRALNEQLNRIPPFAVTLTGGFWYIAVVVQNYGTLSAGYESLARFCLMVFAGVCNLVLVFIAIRVRDVMRAYEGSLKNYAGSSWPDTSRGRIPFLGDYSMIGMYCTLILGGSLLSFVAAFALFWKGTQHPTHVGIVGSILALITLILGYVLLPKLGRK